MEPYPFDARKVVYNTISVLGGGFIVITLLLYLISVNNNIPFSYENGGTDVAFQSSDGGWSGQESMMTGRNFFVMVKSFELYKLKCNKPRVTLQRISAAQDFWKWAWLFDDYDSPKWQVPFVHQHSSIKEKIEYAPQSSNPLFYTYTSEIQEKLAENKALDFIRNLENSNFSLLKIAF
jgi:hypothetical protein